MHFVFRFRDRSGVVKTKLAAAAVRERPAVAGTANAPMLPSPPVGIHIPRPIPGLTAAIPASIAFGNPSEVSNVVVRMFFKRPPKLATLAATGEFKHVLLPVIIDANLPRVYAVHDSGLVAIVF